MTKAPDIKLPPLPDTSCFLDPEWANYLLREYATKAIKAHRRGEPVVQFRKEHCADWYDGYPDHFDGGGPYETRTLYTAPAQEVDPIDIDNEAAANQACNALVGLGYAWNGKDWELVSPAQEPSYAALDELSDDFHGYAGNHTPEGNLIPKFDYIGFARALLARYGTTQPSVPEGWKLVPVEQSPEMRNQDPLQGAANWLVEAIDNCRPTDIRWRLSIGHNRAQRLHAAAMEQKL